MRIVIAPFNRIPEATLAEVKAAGHEVFCCGDPALSYAEIARQYPAGWTPDLFLLWSVEYNPVPLGLEEADCFTAGIFGDWNIRAQSMQQIGGIFDLLIADANGCDRLRALGYENVATAPLWSFDPEVHRRIPGAERDIDVLMIGNINHAVQHERARWLGRIARLSAQRRVCVASGVFGESFTALMNRAKIVFNRSIRGEINMRAYEAPVCGALLFYERENREIASLFRDREECVLYGDDDLEMLLEHYLNHEEERQRIAEAGWRRVQCETPSAHLARVIEVIESRMHPRRPEQRRAFSGYSAVEKELRRARQWLYCVGQDSVDAAEQALYRAEKSGADLSAVAGLRGYLMAHVGNQRTGSARFHVWQTALTHWMSALNARPDDIVTRLNAASLYGQMGALREAEHHARIVYDLAPNPDLRLVPGGLLWEPVFGSLQVEHSRIESSCVVGSETWETSMRSLLRWRACDLLSDLTYFKGRFQEAAKFAGEAVALYGEIAAAHYRYGRAAHALGRVEEAVIAYRAALDHNPFLVEARHSLAQLFIDVDLGADARDLLNDWANIIAGCPPYEVHRQECQLLRALADRAQDAHTMTNTMTSTITSTMKGDAPKRMLAFPDWSQPDQWQALLAAFVRHQEANPSELILWLDPHRYPDPAVPLQEISTYLNDGLGIAFSAFPDITLLAQALEPRDCWKVFRAADTVVVSSGPLPREFQEAFETCGLPILAVEELGRRAA